MKKDGWMDERIDRGTVERWRGKDRKRTGRDGWRQRGGRWKEGWMDRWREGGSKNGGVERWMEGGLDRKSSSNKFSTHLEQE